MTFLSLHFPLRKVQFHQSALMYVAMAATLLFGLFLKTRISIVFQIFPPERNFLWDNLLSFGRPNTLKSLIKANIRTVTKETFQEIFCPNMVIITKTTDLCHVSQSIISVLSHRNPIRCFVIVSNYILVHSSDLSFINPKEEGSQYKCKWKNPRRASVRAETRTYGTDSPSR